MLSLQELRAIAASSGSVNTHLASRYDLRWYDPSWVAAWERWRKASAVWDRTWPAIPFRSLRGGSTNPIPQELREEDREIATEYIESRRTYLELTRSFFTDGLSVEDEEGR